MPVIFFMNTDDWNHYLWQSHLQLLGMHLWVVQSLHPLLRPLFTLNHSLSNWLVLEIFKILYEIKRIFDYQITCPLFNSTQDSMNEQNTPKKLNNIRRSHDVSKGSCPNGICFWTCWGGWKTVLQINRVGEKIWTGGPAKLYLKPIIQNIFFIFYITLFCKPWNYFSTDYNLRICDKSAIFLKIHSFKLRLSI